MAMQLQCMHHQVQILVMLPQVKRLTQHIQQTLDNVASIYINQMVPGRANGTLEMGGNVMVLMKDHEDIIFNQSFRFSPIPGFDSGLTVELVNTGKDGQLTSSDRVLGIGVSQYCVVGTM